MGIELRMPSITGATEREMLAQIRSYLYQFVPQLEWALNHIDSSAVVDYVAPQVKTGTNNQTSSKSAEVAFGDLKSLIIKSAEIVDAYYEEISSRLEGVYVAESDFGTYIEQTEQNILQSSTDIERLFTNLQGIITDIENLNFALAEVNAHIKSGLLYYDDESIPVYGLEIGQKTSVDGEEVFNKFARFTSDRLSFYDQNGTEVAYISDYKLYITNAEVTGTLKLGGFLIDTTKGLTIKWVGRG